MHSENTVKDNSEKTAIIVLIIIYVVGLIGFTFKIHPDFARLTPVNMILSLVFVLYHHKNWNGRMVFFCFFCFLFGFIIEMIGVQTGQIFGQYQYDYALGLKFRNTPLSIGVNWLVVAYCSAMVVNAAVSKNSHWLFKSTLAAALMVSFDVLIEPIAMKTGMWSWQDNVVPMQNYFGWFATALPLQILFYNLIEPTTNKVAVALLILQFSFFLILSFLL